MRLWEEKGELMNQFMTEVFVKQPLASPGSANNLMICIAVCIYALSPPPATHTQVLQKEETNTYPHERGAHLVELAAILSGSTEVVWFQLISC